MGLWYRGSGVFFHVRVLVRRSGQVRGKGNEREKSVWSSWASTFWCIQVGCTKGLSSVCVECVSGTFRRMKTDLIPPVLMFKARNRNRCHVHFCWVPHEVFDHWQCYSAMFLCDYVGWSTAGIQNATNVTLHQQRRRMQANRHGCNNVGFKIFGFV